MNHLLKFKTFNESSGNDENQLTILQSIGFLLDPKDKEVIGFPYSIKPNSEESKRLINLLKEFVKGRQLDENEMKEVMPVLVFVEELQDRARFDAFIDKFLENYQKSGEKETGIISKVKKFYKAPKREKNPVFGR